MSPTDSARWGACGTPERGAGAGGVASAPVPEPAALREPAESVALADWRMQCNVIVAVTAVSV